MRDIRWVFLQDAAVEPVAQPNGIGSVYASIFERPSGWFEPRYHP